MNSTYYIFAIGLVIYGLVLGSFLSMVLLSQFTYGAKYVAHRVVRNFSGLIFIILSIIIVVLQRYFSEPFKRSWFWYILIPCFIIVLPFLFPSSKKKLAKAKDKNEDNVFKKLTDLKDSERHDFALIDYEHYLQERTHLINVTRELRASFDKAMLTLSAGAFGLSLTFLADLFKKINQDTLVFLTSGWLAFGLSIVLTVLSFAVAPFMMNIEIEVFDHKMKHAIDGQECQNVDKENLWAMAYLLFKGISLISFIAGLICMALFVKENVTLIA